MRGFEILLRIVFGLVVLFLSFSGLLRLWEINSDTFKYDVDPYCSPRGFFGWGYECDVDLMSRGRNISLLDNVSLNWSEVVIVDKTCCD